MSHLNKSDLIKQDSMTDEGGDDVTSSPAMSDCEPGMVDLTQQQVLSTPVALTPQPIMLPPGGKGRQLNCHLTARFVKESGLRNWYFFICQKMHRSVAENVKG